MKPSKGSPTTQKLKTPPPSLAGRAAKWIAKPKTKGSEIRRQKIFDDAIAAGNEIARTHGLAGLTARAIAKSIGCSVGTLYNVFDSLDTLIIHLNGTTFDALYEEMKLIEAADDAEATVRRVVDAYLEFVGENSNRWAVIFNHVWPHDYPLPKWYKDKIHRLLEPLAHALAPLFPPGQEDKVGQAAILLWSALHGIQSLSSDAKLGFITSETAHDLSNAMAATMIAGFRDQTGKHGAE